MAFSCGFFNSVNGDRKYNATQMSQIFDGLITDGVIAHYGDHMVVEPLTGMEVNVKSGRCWFNHVWGLNDGNTPIALSASSAYGNRIDAIVVEVDNSKEVRNAFIKCIEGSATVTAKPILIRSDTLNQYPLAYVTVRANSTEILASDIQSVIGTEECPFATGVLESVSIDELFAQWDAEFDEWFDGVQAQLEGDVAMNLLGQINQLEQKKADKTYVDNAVAESTKVSNIGGANYEIDANVNPAFVLTNPKKCYGIMFGPTKYMILTSKNTMANPVVFDAEFYKKEDHSFLKKISNVITSSIYNTFPNLNSIYINYSQTQTGINENIVRPQAVQATGNAPYFGNDGGGFIHCPGAGIMKIVDVENMEIYNVDNKSVANAYLVYLGRSSNKISLLRIEKASSSNAIKVSTYDLVSQNWLSDLTVTTSTRSDFIISLTGFHNEFVYATSSGGPVTLYKYIQDTNSVSSVNISFKNYSESSVGTGYHSPVYSDDEVLCISHRYYSNSAWRAEFIIYNKILKTTAYLFENVITDSFYYLGHLGQKAIFICLLTTPSNTFNVYSVNLYNATVYSTSVIMSGNSGVGVSYGPTEKVQLSHPISPIFQRGIDNTSYTHSAVWMMAPFVEIDSSTEQISFSFHEIGYVNSDGAYRGYGGIQFAESKNLIIVNPYADNGTPNCRNIVYNISMLGYSYSLLLYQTNLKNLIENQAVTYGVYKKTS